MTSYSDDFTVLASVPTVVETEARTNQHATTLVRMSNRRKLAIAPQKYSVTLLTSTPTSPGSNHKGDEVRSPMNRTPKFLGITLDIHFTFGPHYRHCIERASRALNVMKALARSHKTRCQPRRAISHPVSHARRQL